MKNNRNKIFAFLMVGVTVFHSNAQLKQDSILKVTNDKKYSVSATSKISGESLESYPDMVLSNTLQGKLTGLSVIMNTGGVANNPASLYIRGLHRESENGILTIVDGVERNINMLNPAEIASVEVLKDVSAKIKYGPRAANGVLLITTKRGVKNKRTINVNAEYGIGLPTKQPDYLDSYDYARMYNQARANDGLSPVYTPADLAGYRNSTGMNDVRYPNVDFHKLVLRENNEYRKAGVEFSGGNELSKYSFIAGYNGNSGLQAMGETPQRDRFTARGNLDMKVSDMVKAFIGIGGTFDMTKRSSLDHAQTYTALSTHRPNDYAIYISEAYLKPDSIGFPNMGTSNYTTDNLIASLKYGGYQKDQNVNGQLNFGLNFDFNSYIKGLTAKAQLTFDNYFYGSEKVSSNPALYSTRWIQTTQGADSAIFVLRKKASPVDDVTLNNSNTYRTTSVLAELNYSRKLNTSNIVTVNYNYNYYLAENTGSNQDVKFVNNVLNATLINNKKYIADLNFGYMGSNKFVGKNLFAPSYTLGLGWIISQEDFMKNAGFVNFLKLKSTFGQLAYDGQTGYNLDVTKWSDGNAVRINQNLNPPLVEFKQLGNPNLKWEKSREFNVGVEALLFKNHLWVEANYFNELRFDIIEKVDAYYPGSFGGYYPSFNYGKVQNNGVELEVKYANVVGNLNYQIGANVVFSKNKVLKSNEANGIYTNLNRTGNASDAIYGLVSQGLFGKDIALDSYFNQSFGNYKEGDIAYKDIYADGEINDYDRTIIGNSFPRTQLSLDVNLQYRGFGIYILGTTQLGLDNMLSNSYYWLKAEDKYSTQALNSYHPTENPTGTYPRLTTSDGANNYRNSTFWLQAGDFFRLKDVELSYSFAPKASSQVKNVKVFTRGANLFSISANKDLDPEVLNAGVTNYPILTTVTAGVSVSF